MKETKKNNKNIEIAVISIFTLSFIFLVFFGSDFTGFTILGEGVETETITINESFNESTTYELNLEDVLSLKVTGAVKGNATIIANTSEGLIVIYDSKKHLESLIEEPVRVSPMTARVVSSTETTQTETTSEETKQEKIEEDDEKNDDVEEPKEDLEVEEGITEDVEEETDEIEEETEEVDEVEEDIEEETEEELDENVDEELDEELDEEVDEDIEEDIEEEDLEDTEETEDDLDEEEAIDKEETDEVDETEDEEELDEEVDEDIEEDIEEDVDEEEDLEFDEEIDEDVDEEDIDDEVEEIDEEIDEDVDDVLEELPVVENVTIIEELFFEDFCEDTCSLRNINVTSLIIEVESGELFIKELIITKERKKLFEQIKDFENITLELNDSVSFNAEDYFLGEDLLFDITSSEGYTISIDNNNLTITGVKQGNWSARIYALKASDMIRSNEFSINVWSNLTLENITENITEENITDDFFEEEPLDFVVVGEPVKWSKVIPLSNETSKETKIHRTATSLNISKSINQTLSKVLAEDIILAQEALSVDDLLLVNKEKELERISRLEDKISPQARERTDNMKRGLQRSLDDIREARRGRPHAEAPEETLEVTDLQLEEKLEEEPQEKLDILIKNINEKAEYLLLEYETEPPLLVIEEETKNKKKFTITSETHYENILAEIELPQSARRSAIHLHHLTENERIKVEDINYVDENGDGLIDKINWIIPHLSNQTYELELIILNPVEYLVDGDDWTVYFNTTGTGNLTIHSENAEWEKIPQAQNETTPEMKFIEWMCGENNKQQQIKILDENNETHSYYELIQNNNESIKPKKFYIENYTCDDETSSFKNYMNIAGYAELTFTFENENFTIREVAIDPEPIEISTCTELQNIKNNLTASYVLINDIDCSDTVNWNDGVGFIPIGESQNNPFRGSLDGQGYKIKNLYINNNITSWEGGYTGLFGNSVSCNIKSVQLIDVNITGRHGLTAGLTGQAIVGCTIENVSVTGSILAESGSVAGITGWLEGSIIRKSFVDASISGNSNAGGINSDNTWSNSYISDVYVLGEISSSSSATGGAFGEIDWMTSHSNIYSASKIVNMGQGLAGTGSGSCGNSFWDINASNKTTSACGVGKTTTEMMNISTFVDAGWDIVSIYDYDGETWFIDDGYDYPRLGWEWINPIPAATKFDGDTTDFSAVPDLKNVENLILENTTYGRITWINNASAFQQDFDDNIFIEQNTIIVLSQNLDETLNSTANLSFYNQTWTTPQVLKDGVPCTSPICNITSYEEDVLNVSVSGFSNYTVREHSVQQEVLAERIHPEGNIKVYPTQIFNITLNVSCLNEDCGEINVSFDPYSVNEWVEGVSTGVVLSKEENHLNIKEDGVTIAEGSFESLEKINLSGFDALYVEYEDHSVEYEAYLTESLDISLHNDEYYVGLFFVYVSSTPSGTGYVGITSSQNQNIGDYVASKSIDVNEDNNISFYKVWLEDSEGKTYYLYKEGKEFPLKPKQGLISTIQGDIPFFTNSTNNPVTISLNESESELVTMWVEVTGYIGSNHTFFEFVNMTSNESVSDSTSKYNVSIVDPPTILLDRIYPEEDDILIFQNDYFNITLNVTCLEFDCEDIYVSFDPAEKKETKKEEKEVPANLGEDIVRSYNFGGSDAVSIGLEEAEADRSSSFIDNIPIINLFRNRAVEKTPFVEISGFNKNASLNLKYPDIGQGHFVWADGKTKYKSDEKELHLYVIEQQEPSFKEQTKISEKELRYLDLGEIDLTDMAAYYEFHQHKKDYVPTVILHSGNESGYLFYGTREAERDLSFERLNHPVGRFRTMEKGSGSPVVIVNDAGFFTITLYHKEISAEPDKYLALIRDAYDEIFEEYGVSLKSYSNTIFHIDNLKPTIVGRKSVDGNYITLAFYLNSPHNDEGLFSPLRTYLKSLSIITDLGGLRDINQEINYATGEKIVERLSKKLELDLVRDNVTAEEAELVKSLRPILESENWIKYSRRTDVVDKPDGVEKFEVELVLNKKPETNIFEYAIETNNLVFYYQPELSEKEKEKGVYRPQDIVGSYAVYHKKHREISAGQVAGMSGTGKAFHIYRPLIVDAEGKEVWGELSIDEEQGILSITVPQEFLDTAKYPVKVDPTFGFTEQGESHEGLGNTIAGSFFEFSDTMAEGKTMFAYLGGVTKGNTVDEFKFGIYDSNYDLVAGTDNKPSETGGWKNISFETSPTLFNGEYLLVFWCDDDIGGCNTYFDTVPNQGRQKSQIFGEWPSNLGTVGTTDRKHSIYLTYDILSKGLISTTPGTTPFYTNHSENPVKINLKESESELITFWVNATGDADRYLFYEFVNLTSSYGIKNSTTPWFVEIEIFGTPPEINVISPETKTYNENTIWFNATSNKQIDTWKINYDGTNITLTDINSTLEIPEGEYHLKVYGNDSNGFWGVNDEVSFRINSSLNLIESCTTITEPGIYHQAKNFVSSGTCLTIDSSNVKINCDNYEINYGFDSTGPGIRVQSGRNNVTIKNCRINQGAPLSSSRGILAQGASSDIISDLTIDNVTVHTYGSNSEGFYGDYTNNVNISNFRGSSSSSDTINIRRSNNGVLNNIDLTQNVGGRNNINLASNNNGFYINNVISNRSTTTYVINIGSGSTNNIVNNTFITGVSSSRGISISSNNNLVENLNINSTGTSSHGVSLSNQASGNIIRQSHINIKESGTNGGGVLLDDAVNNLFEHINATISGSGAGVSFDGADMDNVFKNSSFVTTGSGPAINIDEESNSNLFIDCVVQANTNSDVSVDALQSNQYTNFVNTPLSSYSFSSDSEAWLNFGYYLAVFVNDSDTGDALENAYVDWSDASLNTHNPTSKGLTDASGWFTGYVFEESVNRTHIVNNNNYTFIASKPGYSQKLVPDTNVTDNTELFFELEYVGETVCVVESSNCFSTIQEAINNASSGNTVMITDSSAYRENVVLNKSITLTHNASNPPKIISESTAILFGASNAVLDCNGMSLEYNDISSGYGIHVLRAVHNATIKNCKIEQLGSNTGSHGLYVVGVTTGSDRVQNLTVSNTSINMRGGSTNLYGLRLERVYESNFTEVSINTPAQTRGMYLILNGDDNYFSDFIINSGGYGAELFASGRRNHFSNFVINSDDYGISLRSVRDSTFSGFEINSNNYGVYVSRTLQDNNFNDFNIIGSRGVSFHSTNNY